EPSPQGTPSLIDGNSVLGPLAPSRASVPTPKVELKEDEPNLAVAPSRGSLTLNSSQPSVAPSPNSSLSLEAAAETRQSSKVAAQQNLAPQQGAVALRDSLDNVNKQAWGSLGGFGKAQGKEAADTAGQVGRNEQTRNDITARITPPLEINPMNSEPAPPGPRSKAQRENTSSPPHRVGWALLPVEKGAKSESGHKAAPKPLDDESFKPLLVRIRDKVFRFERDLKMWIDQAYKPEMRWRVLKLTRGSKQYEQVLSTDPALKEFFDQGPILIIWKDKIYKVQELAPGQ